MVYMRNYMRHNLCKIFNPQPQTRPNTNVCYMLYNVVFWLKKVYSCNLIDCTFFNIKENENLGITPLSLHIFRIVC